MQHFMQFYIVFTETTLESTYKVVQSPWKTTTVTTVRTVLKGPSILGYF